jgi:hypothetical protein
MCGHLAGLREDNHVNTVPSTVDAVPTDCRLKVDPYILAHYAPAITRHSFATRLFEDGYYIRTIQELLGYREVSTTMVYTHVLNRGERCA